MKKLYTCIHKKSDKNAGTLTAAKVTAMLYIYTYNFRLTQIGRIINNNRIIYYIIYILYNKVVFTLTDTKDCAVYKMYTLMYTCITFQLNNTLIMADKGTPNRYEPDQVTQPEKINGTLVFCTPRFELNGVIYLLTAMEKRGKGDYHHTIKNTATGEIRELPHQDLQLWFRRAAV